MNVDAMRRWQKTCRSRSPQGNGCLPLRVREYIESRYDVLQPDIGLAGGITELKRSPHMRDL